MAEYEQGERRSIFLVLATIFANIFLIGFAADAGISLADELLKTIGASPLGDLRELVAGAVTLDALAMLLVVIFVPHLPKLILLPLIFFELWVAFGAPPFDFSHTSTLMALSMVQVVLSTSAFLINKMRTGHWLLNAGLLPHKSHLVLRTIVSFAVLGVFVPFLGLMLLIVAFGSMMEQQTGGYLHFTSSGIEVRETILRRDNKTVRLIGMVHVGDPKFYEDLYASFPANGVVLAEGVTDRDRKLAGSFSYEGLAKVLGLQVQPQLGHVSAGGDAKPKVGAPPQPNAAPQPHEPISIPASDGRPRIIYADADVSDFSPTTIRFLGKVGELYSSSSFSELMARLNAIGDQFTEDDLKGVFDDILAKRNARVLTEFDKIVGDYDTIVLPWGAQHMPGLEAAMRQRGFRIASQRMLPLAQYQMIFDRLWELTQPKAPPQSRSSTWVRQKKWIV